MKVSETDAKRMAGLILDSTEDADWDEVMNYIEENFDVVSDTTEINVDFYKEEEIYVLKKQGEDAEELFERLQEDYNFTKL